MRAVISTNGTLITRDDRRAPLKDIGLSYVGISLDGAARPQRPLPRGPGRFASALDGIRNCQAAGIKVGLRFTINRRNVADIPSIFDLLEERTSRASASTTWSTPAAAPSSMKEDLDPDGDPPHRRPDHGPHPAPARTRASPRRSSPWTTTPTARTSTCACCRRTRSAPTRSCSCCSGTRATAPAGGIGCVSWDGEVHADQFWRHYSFGNVRSGRSRDLDGHLRPAHGERSRTRRPHVKGRCAACQWLDVCGGNFRVRAEAVTGDLWAPGPGLLPHRRGDRPHPHPGQLRPGVGLRKRRSMVGNPLVPADRDEGSHSGRTRLPPAAPRHRPDFACGGKPCCSPTIARVACARTNRFAA